jgi:hypothetical protein
VPGEVVAGDEEAAGSLAEKFRDLPAVLLLPERIRLARKEVYGLPRRAPEILPVTRPDIDPLRRRRR